MTERFARGAKVDRYEILEPIGEGAQSDVYVAVHPFLGHHVAVKCLKVQHRETADARQRFRLEAQTLAKIRHPNVVAVHDGGITTDDFAFLVMDFLEGLSLGALLRRVRRLAPAQTTYYAQQIADGLAAAHRQGVVHRDVKPDNLFITWANQVKLLDLGTAKFFGTGHAVLALDRNSRNM